MKLALCLGFVLVSATTVFASGGKVRQVDNRTPVKLPIRHADPWAVKALIEGTSISQPELSTIIGMLGGAANRSSNNTQGANSPLLKDGFLVVNPTDNSLWWYPKRN